MNLDVPFMIDTEVGKSFGDGDAVEYKEGLAQNLQEILEKI